MDAKLFEMAQADPRYAYEAFEFVCDAVSYTQEMLGRAAAADDDTAPADRHVSGPELTRGVVELAVSEFGLMAPVVFRHWGVHTTDDIGNVVFGLIAGGRLSQSDRDDPSDFCDLFDLPKALADGFSLVLEDALPHPRRLGR